MGVIEFNKIVDTTVRQASRQTSPDRWDADDPWFEEQHRRRN